MKCGIGLFSPGLNNGLAFTGEVQGRCACARHAGNSSTTTHRFWRACLDRPQFLAGAVLLALLIRLTVVTCLFSKASPHTINYNDFGWESWEMGWTARSILLGHGFSSPFQPITGPTALVPPLYPYVLAGLFRIFGVSTLKVTFAVLGFNSLCSSLTCIPIYFLTLKILNRRAARITALAWAIYPFSVYFAATRVWDYALTSLLISCCLLTAEWLPSMKMPGWIGFGLLYGLAMLSNPSVALLLPIFLLNAIDKLRRSQEPWLAKGLAVCLAVVCTCAPWTIRNERVMHAHFFIRDGFWLEFYAGNNGDVSEPNSSWAHPASNPIEMKKYESEGEIAYMAEKRTLALNFVEHRPAFFAVATLRRTVRFWTGLWSLSPRYLSTSLSMRRTFRFVSSCYSS